MSGAERRLYLIRHGKADRRSSGETVTARGAVADPPLDATGREHSATWHVKRRNGAVLVRVHLQPGEAAVIERGGSGEP